MERVKQVLDASALWRALMALCAWVGGQWDRSGIVQWFLHPRGWTPAASEGSIFYKLWALVRRGLCRYRKTPGRRERCPPAVRAGAAGIPRSVLRRRRTDFCKNRP